MREPIPLPPGGTRPTWGRYRLSIIQRTGLRTFFRLTMGDETFGELSLPGDTLSQLICDLKLSPTNSERTEYESEPDRAP